MFKLLTNVVHEAVVTRFDPIINEHAWFTVFCSPPKIPPRHPAVPAPGALPLDTADPTDTALAGW